MSVKVLSPYRVIKKRWINYYVEKNSCMKYAGLVIVQQIYGRKMNAINLISMKEENEYFSGIIF